MGAQAFAYGRMVPSAELYPSSGLSAAAQYRLPRPRRRIVPVSLPPAGAGHVRNDPRRRGLESGNESRSPWRKPGELAALSARFAPICFPTPRCTRRPASADVARGMEFVSGLPGLPTRARTRGVIFVTRPGPGSGAREGSVIAPQSVLALWFSS